MSTVELGDLKKAGGEEDKDLEEREESEEAADEEEHDAGGHGQHATVEETTAWRLHVFVDSYPLGSFCIFLWMYLVTWIILIPIVATVGNDAIYLTTEVPMYMRSHKSRQNQDALEAAWDDADYQLSAEVGTTRQQTQASVELKLVFIAKKKDGIVRADVLQKINDISGHVLSADNYEDYCQRVYETTDDESSASQCKRHFSVTQFFDPGFFKGAVNQTYDVQPTTRNTQQFVAPSTLFDSTAAVDDFDFSDENMATTTQYWAEYAQGTVANDSEYGQGEYQNRLLPAKFYYVTQSSDGSTENSLANVFDQMTDKKFGETPESTKVKAAMVVFHFGYPLQGYDSDSDDTDKQDEDISEWAYEELNNYFFKVHNKAKYNKLFTMRWGIGTMDDFYLADIIVKDMTLLVGTILCVWLYTVFSLKSFFLASMAMCMIFLNFAPALFLYRYISGIKYFGTLNMLSIFIILSIGADDVFVLCDAWEQTRASSPKGCRAKRLSHTMNHAAKVMATTSISTIFSFLGNVTSVFPAVYTFGAFAAWLVWVNYCGVVLFFPTVLTVHETYFFTPTAKYPWCVPKSCVERQAPNCCLENLNFNKEKVELSLAKAQKRAEGFSVGDDRRAVDLWFENTVHSFIMRWRRSVLAGFFLFFVVFLAFATQLVPDPNPPQFFPDGNNYYEFDYALLDYFGSADNLRLNLAIVFGVQKIKRKGTDEAIPEDIGKPVWDEDFSWLQADEQLFLAQLCDDLLCGYQEYDCRYPDQWLDLEVELSDDENGMDVVRCFMTAFRDWVVDDASAKPNGTEIAQLIADNNLTTTVSDYDECNWGEFPSQPVDCAVLLFAYIFLREELPTSNPDFQPGMSNYDYWKDYIGAEPTDAASEQMADVRFVVIEVDLDAYSTTDYSTGINLWEDWESWFDARWMLGADGAVSVDRYGDEFVAPPMSLLSGFFTDSGGIFTYYFLQRQIIYESLSGIAISLSLAFGVLVAATGNWIIAIWAITTITQLVICIMGYTVMCGYKLGVMEAIIFVMVVGMVVDYVVHCSEAYLSSPLPDRVGRSKAMLGLVGASVLSGSLSTVLGVFWMCFATIPFFFKFGTAILFQEATSLAFALVAFTAILSAAGPEHDDGDVRKDFAKVKAWFHRKYQAYYGLEPPKDEAEDVEDSEEKPVVESHATADEKHGEEGADETQEVDGAHTAAD